MTKRRKLAHAAVFAVIIYIVGYLLTQLFMVKTDESFSKNYYNYKKDSFDVIFAGSSVMMYGVYPTQLFEEYGISSYNMSYGNQSLACSYYMIKSAIRKDSPKLVVLDTFYSTYREIYLSKEFVHYMTDNMSMFDPVRYEAINDLIDKEDRFEFYVPMYLFHSRWKELGEGDFQDEYGGGYKDITLGAKVSGKTKTPEPLETGVSDEDLPEVSKEWLLKIIDLCREENVPLLLTMMPVQGRADFYNDDDYAFSKRAADQIAEIAAANNVPFLDFMNDNSVLGLDPTTDTKDGVHLNYSGASKMTSFLGAHLYACYDLQDHRGEKEYKFYDAAADCFDEWLPGHMLSTNNDLPSYLKYLKQYGMEQDIFTAIELTGSGDNIYTDEVIAGLKELGLDHDFASNKDGSFFAVFNDGQLLASKLSEPDSRDEFKSRIGNIGVLVESDTRSTAENKIRIDDGNYSLPGNGLNIAVYNIKTGTLLDAVHFEDDPDQTAQHMYPGEE